MPGREFHATRRVVPDEAAFDTARTFLPNEHYSEQREAVLERLRRDLVAQVHYQALHVAELNL
jgi:hypothetical protein